ncbi:sensor histidine kinase [Ohtaekwangia koreensis]|uniref:Histidine kinase n=1 Tax=Ohtaekwangia koreensis TaxID=688867 RepID=A0A1T5JHN6_9BACT|nr:sensor histidine kinase [Ohtaekwangia koreensis]SKC50981.1 Histidine kinase [Ohtaekwangia koreensis]
MSKGRNLLIHTTGWVLFLVIPIVFSPGPAFSVHTFFGGFMQREMIACILLIAYFYFNVQVLITRFYFTKKYTLYFLIIAGCFMITTLVPFLLLPNHPKFSSPIPPVPQRAEEGSILFEFGHNFFRFSVVTFISLTLKISNRWKQAEQDKLTAQLSYLKAQINPHFLFNTLNSIYSLAIQKSDHTPSAVVKLSSMMRYVVSESNRDFVSLEKELSYIRNYVELQQLRFGDAIELLFFVHGNAGTNRIAPLILIPFVENAFKHGINAEESSRIKVSIEMDHNELRLEVFNNKVFTRGEEEKSGLGIENTRNRLQLLYPKRHTLIITDNKNDFSVSLTIQLK